MEETKVESSVRVKIFFDEEFTGLHKGTTLISIGLISETGKTFYAEFNDYAKDQIDEWLQKNVIDNLKFNHVDDLTPKAASFNMPGIQDYSLKSDTATIAKHLKMWLEQFGDVEMWSDCLAYDWVLFNHIFGHAFDIPKNVYYIPFDICTMFKLLGIDPDISREKFANYEDSTEKHNALHDAKVIKLCYEKMQEMLTEGYSV